MYYVGSNHEAIISPEVYDLVQEKFKKRAKRNAKLQEESEIIVELMKNLIYENSRKVMNQDEYNKNTILILRNMKK